MPIPAPQLEERLHRLRQRGLNLAGAVSGNDFDRCQPKGSRACERLPGCRTILVLGSGGPAHWNRMEAPRHPDRLSAGAAAELDELVADLARIGHESSVVHPHDPRPLNFVRLGEMAGLGTVSPVVNLLIHPEYGLWVRLRAALLITGTPFSPDLLGAVPSTFQPCTSCHRPCVSSCPAQVYREDGVTDVGRCARHRHTGACSHGCDARAACPVGGTERFSPEEEAMRHAGTLPAMRRHFGLGVWRLVPGPLRRLGTRAGVSRASIPQ